MSDVRAALEKMLFDIVSIKSASGYPTENVGAQPFAFVGFDSEDVTMGGAELSIHTLPITVLVTRTGGNLVNQTKAVEAVIEDVKDAVRPNQSLGLPGFVYRTVVKRIDEGIYNYAKHDYVGFIATLEIKTRKNVSASA